ncbi:MAG: hypothetical protein AW10_03279 [Candidatus Accumulibacter appositus]|uniref:Uncharacterized protein n=1 Tax=Candidatus Accumulibacter appositus TaxID=1454003 RepID=A0A011PMV7_9PROT|nr:MAG: hypothetical protein AW10_03279 [Candidatus Accumulibacter appositus]
MTSTTGEPAANAATCGLASASLPSRGALSRRHGVTGLRRRSCRDDATGTRHERIDPGEAAALARVSRTVLGCSSAMARAWLSASSATLPSVPRRSDWPGLRREDASRNTLQDYGAVLWGPVQVAWWLLDRSEDRGRQRASARQWQEGRPAEKAETRVIEGKVGGRFDSAAATKKSQVIDGQGNGKVTPS